MKKNNSMRVAIVVIALTLITSCFVGTTFAKYKSTVTGSATATVAKWDIKAGVVGGEASITGDDPTVAFNLFSTIVDTYDDGENAYGEPTNVAAGKIAPGTKGEFTFSIKNSSEVTAKWKVDFDGTDLDGVPIQFRVDPEDGDAWVDFEDLEGTDFANIAMNTTASITIEWRWAFGDDVDDTDLGVDGANPVVKLNLTVEQVD